MMAPSDKSLIPEPWRCEVINTLLLLLVFELVGEVLVRVTDLPLPGPVVGMFALLGTLMLRGRSWPELDAAATTLLSHLSLLFIPAGVGVILHFQRLGAEWLPLLTALVLGTVVTLAITAWSLSRLLQVQARHQRSKLRAGWVVTGEGQS